jgi:hypothetical protein
VSQTAAVAINWTILSIVIGAASAISGAIVAYFVVWDHRAARTRKETDPSNAPIPIQASRSAPESSGGETRTVLSHGPRVLAEKRVVVRATRHVALRYSLDAGDRVHGMVVEAASRPFTLTIHAEQGYARFRNGNRTKAAKSWRDVSATSFDFEVPATGRWYFVLDARRKQNDRVIDVTIELT